MQPRTNSETARARSTARHHPPNIAPRPVRAGFWQDSHVVVYGSLLTFRSAVEVLCAFGCGRQQTLHALRFTPALYAGATPWNSLLRCDDALVFRCSADHRSYNGGRGCGGRDGRGGGRSRSYGGRQNASDGGGGGARPASGDGRRVGRSAMGLATGGGGAGIPPPPPRVRRGGWRAFEFVPDARRAASTALTCRRRTDACQAGEGRVTQGTEGLRGVAGWRLSRMAGWPSLHLHQDRRAWRAGDSRPAELAQLYQGRGQRGGLGDAPLALLQWDQGRRRQPQAQSKGHAAAVPSTCPRCVTPLFVYVCRSATRLVSHRPRPAPQLTRMRDVDSSSTRASIPPLPFRRQTTGSGTRHRLGTASAPMRMRSSD